MGWRNDLAVESILIETFYPEDAGQIDLYGKPFPKTVFRPVKACRAIQSHPDEQNLSIEIDQPCERGAIGERSRA